MSPLPPTPAFKIKTFVLQPLQLFRLQFVEVLLLLNVVKSACETVRHVSLLICHLGMVLAESVYLLSCLMVQALKT